MTNDGSVHNKRDIFIKAAVKQYFSSLIYVDWTSAMLSDLSNCALHFGSYDGISTDCILFLCSPEGVGGAPSLMSSGHSQTHRYVSVFVQWRREELDGTAFRRSHVFMDLRFQGVASCILSRQVLAEHAAG